MYEKTLIEFGLSEKEAKVYLVLLELEIATVQEIARASGINRSSTYVVLESLKEQGLVSVADDKKVQEFVATSPEAFVRMAADEERKNSLVKEKLISVMPELKALYKGVKQKPRVRIFEGKQGLINAFEDTLNSKEKHIRVFSSAGNLFKVLPDYLPKYLEKRKEKKIKMSGIHPNEEADKILVKNSLLNLDVHVLIPNYSFQADLGIYDNKIAYMSLENKGLAIIIENSGIANIMKNVFDLALKEAKRLSKAR